jgi:hypothetical protein
VTALSAFCVVSAALVAVNVTVFGVGKLVGAVYIPFVSIVPTVALPPATAFTDQVTAVFVEPVTVAANAPLDPARIVAVAGVTVTLVPPLSGGSGEPSPPRFVPRPEQPLSNKTMNNACTLQIRFTALPPSNLDCKQFSAKTAALALLSFGFRLTSKRSWALLLGYGESRECVRSCQLASRTE